MAPLYFIAPLLLSLSFTLPVYAQATTSLPPGTNGQQNVCNAIAKFCPGGFPASPDCIDKWCKGGPNGPCDPNCCSQPNRLACIKAIGSSPSSTLISDLPSSLASMAAISTQDPGSNRHGACGSIETIAISCSRKYPALTDASMADWAKCLCFDKNGQFNPNPFDDNASSCYNSMTSAKAISGKDFSSTYIDFCSKNVDAGPTTSSSGTTTTATTGAKTSSTASPGSKGASSPAPTTSSGTTPSPTSPPTSGTASSSTSPTASAQTVAAAPALKVSWMESLVVVAVVFLV